MEDRSAMLERSYTKVAAVGLVGAVLIGAYGAYFDAARHVGIGRLWGCVTMIFITFFHKQLRHPDPTDVPGEQLIALLLAVVVSTTAIVDFAIAGNSAFISFWLSVANGMVWLPRAILRIALPVVGYPVTAVGPFVMWFIFKEALRKSSIAVPASPPAESSIPAPGV